VSAPTPDDAPVQAKRALRGRLLAMRRAQDPAAVAAASLRLSEELKAHSSWREARGLAAFVGVRGEADTRPLLQATLAAGKALWLPKVLGGGRMAFALVDDLAALVEGRMGLLEPAQVDEALAAPGPERGVDLVLVPGLAFDSRGGRIGFGAGHYDRAYDPRRRAAAGLAMPTLCGLCLRAFIEPEGPVPMADHDLRMDLIASDAGVIEL